MSETDRDDAPPAAPAPAEPEEPQTSVHEQPAEPEPAGDRETDPDAG